MHGGLKMLEIIIIEVTFTEFSIWVFFHEQLQEERRDYLFNSSAHLNKDTSKLACRLPQRAHIYI